MKRSQLSDRAKISSAVRAVLDRLEGVKRSGKGWTGLCPAHDDREPSLSIGQGEDGRVLLKCHASCETEGVVAALGLSMADLFPDAVSADGYTLRQFARDKHLPTKFLRQQGVRTVRRKGKSPCVAIDYFDTTGSVVATRFRSRRRHWWKRGAVMVPYGLPELAAASPETPVLIVEGESDVLTCRYHDVLAVGIPGATVWNPEWAPLFADREVYVCREPDAAGHRFVASVTRSLPNARVLDLPTGIKDVSELHLEDPSQVRTCVETLMQAAEIGLPPGVRRVIDALADPEAMRGRKVVVPYLAWEGRVSLLAAREKSGKSTLASAAAVAVSEGTEFLGEQCEQGAVLWLVFEEDLSDLLERLQRFGVRSREFYCTFRRPETLDELEAIAKQLRPRLIVIDTLPALAERWVSEAGSSAQWTPIMSAIARIARVTRAAILLLHHAKKSDSRYRDSTAIGAGVDIILEMDRVKNAPQVRDLEPQGRWSLPRFSVAYDGVSYRLVGQQLDVNARALAWIEAHPKQGKRAIRDGVGGRGQNVDAVVRQLEAAGRINNVGTERVPKYVAVSGVPPSQGPRDTPSEIVSHPGPHGGDTGTHAAGPLEGGDEIFEFDMPQDLRPPRQRRTRR